MQKKQVKKTNTKPNAKSNKKKKRKIRIRRILYSITILFLLSIIFTLFILIFTDKDLVKNKEMDIVEIKKKENTNNILVKLNQNGYCSLDKEEWIKSNKSICEFVDTFILDKLFLKDEEGNIIEKDLTVDYSYIEDFNVNKEKMILAVNAQDKIDYGVVIKGKMETQVEFTSDNNDIATVSEDGTVTGVSAGETTIHVKFKDKEDSIAVKVSSLIMPIASDFNFDKDYLTCDIYSKEENDELDEILKFRVTEAGYKTRAGAVAAARFIGLEFPYIINYFSENGRYPGVDGEGRYYHEGLYLNKSRYSVLSNSMHGPGVWGCYIHSVPAEKEIRNGLDCSGFITWIIKQAGYSPGDLGAGVSPGIEDMTDLGEKIHLTEEVVKNSLKPGDLLSGDGVPDIEPINGGHIAMVAGINGDDIYVSEELWWGTGYVGAVIRKYSTKDLLRYFYWQVDMNEFYGEDGNLTNYWIK